MARTKSFLLLLISTCIIGACGAQPAEKNPVLAPGISAQAPTQTQVALTQVTSAATQVTEPVSSQSPSALPLTEAEVPRVPVDQAKAAFDRGEAIIVDVRSADAYAASHVAGAINIQLGDIETNPTGLNLDKDKWIITYCT